MSLNLYEIICNITEKKFNPAAWNKELFFYHGSLSKYESQFHDPRFVGLAYKYRRHSREIKCDLNGRIPLSDNSVDAFQSQDVIEHIRPENIIFCLNEVYRVLKHNCLFRLSLPNYQSPFLKRRSIYNYKGKIIGDAAMGDQVYVEDFDSDLKIKSSFDEGERHLWFPTYELVNKYIQKSNFAKASSCKWIHANLHDESYILNEIPHNDVFNVMRCPPSDMRSKGLPVSLIVDLIK